MSSTMDDYYELLGVEADAPVDEIRSAYRDKKAAVADVGTDEAKADAAALNKAWNVLSDPYQRGRYDQMRADADGYEGDDDGDEGDDDEAPAARKRPARTTDRADKRRNNARAPLKPTVTLPAGTRFPATRQRLVAMAIDVVVLIALFLVAQAAVVPKLEKSNHPAAYAAARDLTNNKIPKAHDATTAAKKKASAKVNCDTHPTAANDKAYCDAKAAEKSANDELTKQNKVLLPLQNLVTAIFFLVSLLILIVPSAFGGATLGKRTQRIRVIRTDGSPVRVMDLFRRYTLLVFSAYVLSTLLGPVGAVVVVFVATLWSRNPNQQALQDRFARTLVVTDG